MNPDSENPTDQNNPLSQQGETPVPPASPGGVIKPAGAENNFGTAPQPDVPAADTQKPPEPINNPQRGSQPTPPGYEIFPSDSNTPHPSPKRGFLSKKLLLIVLPFILVLLIGGYIFGFYIPNKPENVYKTGLDRSGDALEVLVSKATEQATYDKFKATEITGAMDMNFDQQNVSGNFRAKYTESKLDSDFNLSFPSSESGDQFDLGFSLLSSKAEGKEFPDAYLNLRGIEAFGADFILPGISKYDGKWLAVSSDYFQLLADEYGLEPEEQQGNTEDLPTFEEISSTIRSFYDVTNEYVFTSNPQKAVLENRQYLGKEKVDGTDTFHYEVGVNKENARAYCEAVSKVLLDSTAATRFMGLSDEEVEQEKQRIGEDCQKDSEDIKDDQTFEMWIDSKYKLIKKIRIYSDDDKTAYYELGQNYDGGDEISLFLSYTTNPEGFNAKVTFTTDLNTAESSGELTFSGGEESDKYDGTVTLSAKPLTEDFEVKRPDGAVDIEKFLKEVGINPEELAGFYGGTQSKAKDAEVKSNVNAIYSHIEVYFAENAVYPTKSQLNDQSWQASNLTGFNADFLSGVEYDPSDCNDDGCLKYTLSAKLSDGSTFEKTGSNN